MGQLRTITTNGTKPNEYDEIGDGITATAYYGYIDKAYRPELKWPGAHTIYDPIWRGNPETTVTRNMFSSLVGKVSLSWELPLEMNNKELPPPTSDDEAALDFCYSVGDDIEGDLLTWLSDCAIKTPFYGFGMWEMVPGKRLKNWKPPNDDPWRSNENDGLVGFRRFGFRDYSTFNKWIMTPKGYIQGIEQLGTNTGSLRPIPANRLLHIRYGDLSNPEGIATMEAVYRLEYFKRQLEVVLGHGFEKSAGILNVQSEAAKLSPTDKQNIREVARAVLSAQEGNFMAWPKGLTGKIEDIPFSAAASLLEAIRYYSLMILSVYSMQFIGMGGLSGTGSYAALNDSSSVALLIFNNMVSGFTKQASEQITRQLFTLNAGAFPGLTRMPILKASPIAKSVSLTELAQFASAIKAVMPLGDDDFIAIRKKSEILPESLPEVEEITEPEPEPEDSISPDETPDDAMGNEQPEPDEGEEGEGEADMMRPFNHIHHDLAGPAQTGDDNVDPQLKAYYDQLEELSQRAIRGEIEQGDFEKQAEDIIIAATLLMFILGGGNPESPEAQATITRQRGIALQSVNDLSRDIYAGKFSAVPGDPVKTAAKGKQLLANRLALFTVTAYGLYNAGKIFQPPTVKTVTKPDGTTETQVTYKRKVWRRGPTEEGCKDCVTLDGVVLTTQEWQRLEAAGVFPQSNQLECNGYNCLCGMYDTEAESVGIDSVLSSLGV